MVHRPVVFLTRLARWKEYRAIVAPPVEEMSAHLGGGGLSECLPFP